MIAHLTGKILTKKPTDLIVEVQGIGYLVHISLTTHSHIGLPGEAVKLFTRQYIREDSIQLFGFATEVERDIFNMLITVTGIGPKLALIILSGMKPADLQQALATENETALCRISGVGKKTAKRLIIELKEKMADLGLSPSADWATMTDPGTSSDEAVQALVALGFKTPAAKSTVSAIQKKLGPDASVEEIIRLALKGE